MSTAGYLDRYSRGTTVCHCWPAAAKLLATLAVIAAALCVPLDCWPVQAALAFLIFAAQSLAEIPLSYLWQRLLGFLPFVVMLSIALPLGQADAAGWELFGGIVARSTLSFMAGLWLVNVTPFDQLLAAFRRFGMPLLFVAILAFMYRYVFVVFDELARMRAARSARSFGRRGAWRAWAETAQLLGMLLIRSLNRAERVYGAMCARGWDGHIRTLDSSPVSDLTDRRFSLREEPVFRGAKNDADAAAGRQ